MSYNGSGVYTLPGAALVNGEIVSATENNQFRNDVAAALNTAWTRDGQAPATGNIPMGTHKFTGLAAGTAATDSVNLGQSQSSASQLIGNISGTNTITGDLSPALSAYATGQSFRFVSAGANTGAVTLNINGLGAKAITKQGATALSAGDIPADSVINVVYDGAQFQISAALTTLTGGQAGQVPVQSAPGVTTFMDSSFAFKNRIINGAMMIDQRNAGASVTPAASGPAYLVDRWSYYNSQVSKLTYQQNYGSVVPPTGFKNYFGVYVASSATVGASDEFGLFQRIEGFNTADLGFGAAGASSVTLSFWVRSSLTGTFGGSLSNSGNSRSYPFTYTINSANTWEQKSITVAGDISGTWVGATSGIGLSVSFSMGAGSSLTGAAGSWASANYAGASGQVNLVANAGATFYITGVQLEKGSTATSFDYRPYGTEQALCQRYYLATTLFVGTSGQFATSYTFPSSMRTAPTVTGGGAGYGLALLNNFGIAHIQTTNGAQAFTFAAEL